MQPKQPEKIFQLAAYDPDQHGAFVRSTFSLGALRDGSRASRRRFDSLLELDGSRCLVAETRDDRLFAGWAGRTDAALIFAYVKPAVRRRGLAAWLLRELGFTDGKPIPLMFWTPSAMEIAADNGRVFYAAFSHHREVAA